MDILYRRRRAAVEDVRGELPDPPSTSAVRKLLEILMSRGHVGREYDGQRYLYFPVTAPEQASRSALEHLVRTFFDGSPGATMAALLDLKGPLSGAEYERLARLLDEARENGEGE